MRGLQADERVRLEWTARVSGRCDGVSFKGKPTGDSDAALDERLEKQGRVFRHHCTCAYDHYRITPAGKQALALDAMARQTVPV